AATGAELDVGHGTVWVNGDIRYIAMQFSRLEAFLGAGLTDSGKFLATPTSSHSYSSLSESHTLTQKTLTS
ncbi:hypothetical protein, partial [Chromohalobacter japonicus]|uniref:hypothetical protein n=1 Tax=Chromohalobacter japonicus TaxID=223900 RepID=UPI0035E75924